MLPFAGTLARQQSGGDRLVRSKRGRASSEPACTVARPENPWITGS
jgi:hypothetical protein